MRGIYRDGVMVQCMIVYGRILAYNYLVSSMSSNLDIIVNWSCKYVALVFSRPISNMDIITFSWVALSILELNASEVHYKFFIGQANKWLCYLHRR